MNKKIIILNPQKQIRKKVFNILKFIYEYNLFLFFLILLREKYLLIDLYVINKIISFK
jgi:hypothetical protein